MKLSYSYAELRKNLRQVLDLADTGKVITIERLDAKWGEGKFRAKKTYSLKADSNRGKTPKPE